MELEVLFRRPLDWTDYHLYPESPKALTTNMRQVELNTHSPSPLSLGSDVGLLDDLRSFQTTENMLTLEDLKNHYSSCFTCGVSWNEDHVSLDCFECGGYSMERPCPVCDGSCKQIWRRDLAMSHSMRKAHWEGECGLPSKEQQAFFLKNLVDATEDSLSEALQDLKASS